MRFSTMKNGRFNIAFLSGKKNGKPFVERASDRWPTGTATAEDPIPDCGAVSVYEIGPVCWDEFVNCRQDPTGNFKCAAYSAT